MRMDRDKINEVLARMTPGVSLNVDQSRTSDGSQMAVDLKFRSMDDFDPGSVVDQVEPLRKLLETRNKLRDLMTKVDRSEDLESLLEQVLQNDEELKRMASDLGISPSGGGNDTKQED